MNRFTEHLQFYRQFRDRFETTGAVAPSSRFLARALTSPLLTRQGSLRVLEVGPGTGAVTSEIVRRLPTGSRFDLVEINEEFADLLRHRFLHDPDFAKMAEQSSVHCCPLQEFQAEEPFDVIVSGLPFNNFPAPLVEELIDLCLSLLAPGGEMAFFEYMFVRPIRCKISPVETRTRLKQIEDILQQRFSEYRTRTDWVFVNIPPAWVQHLRREATGT
ncbi:MAG: methyltransferase domain-containing protein, partial [Planctomycetaceae bacterium]|nr:methyltransferase domain-containing protein [Planctomycetaceae bacterium]